MISTRINDRWTLLLPEHRAARPEWATGWEVARLDSMHANLEPGMVVYDIGAEEGDLCALWSSWGCDVVLVEPNHRVWPNIRAIWDANQLRAPIGCFAGFAASDDSFLGSGDPLADGVGPDGHRRDHNGWPECAHGPVIGDHGFCVIPERPDIARIRIDTIEMSSKRCPHAITMDVEGAELEVLRGAGHVLEVYQPMLWISVHPNFMLDTFGHHVSELWGLLRRFGYVWRLLDYDHELHCFAWHPARHSPVLP